MCSIATAVCHAIDDIFAVKSFEQCLEVTVVRSHLCPQPKPNSGFFMFFFLFFSLVLSRPIRRPHGHSSFMQKMKTILGLLNYRVPSTNAWRKRNRQHVPDEHKKNERRNIHGRLRVFWEQYIRMCARVRVYINIIHICFYVDDDDFFSSSALAYPFLQPNDRISILMIQFKFIE